MPSKSIRLLIYTIIAISVIFFTTVHCVKKQKNHKLRQFLSVALAVIFTFAVLWAYYAYTSNLTAKQTVKSFCWDEIIYISNQKDNSLRTVTSSNNGHTLHVGNVKLEDNEEIISIEQFFYVVCSDNQKYICKYPTWKDLAVGDCIILNYEKSNPPTVELPSNKT